MRSAWREASKRDWRALRRLPRMSLRGQGRLSSRQANTSPIQPRSRRIGCDRKASIRACWLCRSRDGCGTGITSDTWPSSLVWFAVGGPRIPTIRALPRAGRSGARSAMSSPCPYAEGTIARCTAVAMKLHGGRMPGLIRPSPPARCGLRRIRWRQVRVGCRFMSWTLWRLTRRTL
jgi:hypothetical protein